MKTFVVKFNCKDGADLLAQVLVTMKAGDRETAIKAARALLVGSPTEVDLVSAWEVQGQVIAS